MNSYPLQTLKRTGFGNTSWRWRVRCPMTYMRPVAKLPVHSLANRLVGAQVTLANGQRLDALLGNIELNDPLSTEHFVSVDVFNSKGRRFDLARYHDVDYSRRDDRALAKFLRLAVKAVFPMHYDISDIAVGHADCLRRSILAVPKSRLSEKELTALALR